MKRKLLLYVAAPLILAVLLFLALVIFGYSEQMQQVFNFAEMAKR